MLDGPTEGALELIIAVFRMAVADYLGLAYGHDQVGRERRVRSCHRVDAERFLRNGWAASSLETAPTASVGRRLGVG
jgi:hypothetical protein